MQTNELKQKITEVFMSFEEFPEANTELFVDDILDLFKKEYEENLRWIPVEEKLPEPNSDVLAKGINGRIEVLHFKEIQFSTVHHLRYVTHWRYFL